MDFSFGADQVRTVLHILGAAVWLGGQVVMLGILPTLRKLGADAPRQVAAAFGRVSWPAFAILVATGIWNILTIDLGDVTTGYNAAFGIKMLLVVASGISAGVHQSTDKPAIRGMTGGIGFLSALAAFVLGIAMAH